MFMLGDALRLVWLYGATDENQINELKFLRELAKRAYDNGATIEG